MNGIGTTDARLVAWLCLCPECGDEGMIEMMPDEYVVQCNVCNGVGRDPIPWSEIFRVGRDWMPDPYGLVDQYNEDEEDWYDEE